VSTATLPALALGANGTVYVAWGGRDAAEFNSSGPVCYAQRSLTGVWSVTALTEREAQGDRFALDLDSQGQLYLLRGARDRLGYCRLDGSCPAYDSHPPEWVYGDNKADYGYIQEVLYVERYTSPGQAPDTFLVNTYPAQDETGAVDPDDDVFADLPEDLPDPVSMLAGDLAVDDAGNVTVVWVDNYEAWDDNHKPRPRTVTIPADAPLPQVTKHYYANGQRIASRVDDNLYYILGDHLGSTSLVVDESGAEQGYVIYDAYGQVVENTLPEGLTDRLYTGQVLDASTGLFYYNARYYDPFVGQFTQPDSLVADPLDPRAWNRFSYVYNSPVNLVDPTGHFACGGVCLFAIGFIVGSLTNYAAGAYFSDDPASYLLSQEAGIDLLTGGIFGGVASLLSPGVVTFRAAARVSAGTIFRRQAIGFGLLNVMQGELSVAAKQGWLGQIPNQQLGRRVGTNFVYGFIAPFVARGGPWALGKLGSRVFHTMKHRRIPAIRKLVEEIYSGYAKTQRFHTMGTIAKKPWDKQTAEFILSSYPRTAGNAGYYAARILSKPIGQFYDKVITNSNALPIFGNELLSAVDPLR
jgi:RHS repeat-associated protein